MTAFESERRSGHNPEGNALQKAVSRHNAVRELREVQELTLNKIRSGDYDERVLPSLLRALVDLREQIRIEKGWIKPGSRNVSVREMSPADQMKRIGPRASRPTDYLADAARVIAQAEAQSAPIQPADPSSK